MKSEQYARDICHKTNAVGGNDYRNNRRSKLDNVLQETLQISAGTFET